MLRKVDGVELVGVEREGRRMEILKPVRVRPGRGVLDKKPLSAEEGKEGGWLRGSEFPRGVEVDEG